MISPHREKMIHRSLDSTNVINAKKKSRDDCIVTNIYQ